jgi:hypothetical protein
MALAGLLHDFAEGCGYGDIASPLKPDSIRRAESRILGLVAKRLGFSRERLLQVELNSELLKEADRAAAEAERLLLFSGQVVDMTPMVSLAVEITRDYMGAWSGTDHLAWVDFMEELLGFLVEQANGVDDEVFTVLSRSSRAVRGRFSGSMAGWGADGLALDKDCSTAKDKSPSGGDGLGSVGGPGVGTAVVTSTGRAATGWTMCCSVCGAWWEGRASHLCHPDYAESD